MTTLAEVDKTNSTIPKDADDEKDKLIRTLKEQLAYKDKVILELRLSKTKLKILN